VGAVVPSLIAMLLPFASHPSASERLLPLVSRFAQQLDSLVLTTRALADADAAYVAFRVGEPSPVLGAGLSSAPSSSNSSLSSSSSSFAAAAQAAAAEATAAPSTCSSGVGGSSGNSSSASGGGGSAELAPQLPRVLSLLKSTAFLAANLAGTLVVAADPSSPSLEHNNALMGRRVKALLCSPVLSFGIGATYASSSATVNTAAKDANVAADASALEASAAILAQWVRAAYGQLDPGYAMVVKQAMAADKRQVQLQQVANTSAHSAAPVNNNATSASNATLGGVEPSPSSSATPQKGNFEAHEDALFAVLLHHTGLDAWAALAAKAASDPSQQGAAAGAPAVTPATTAVTSGSNNSKSPRPHHQRNHMPPLSQRRPPWLLLSLWRLVAESSVSLWRQRASLRASSSSSSGDGAHEVDLFARTATASHLLLSFWAPPPVALLRTSPWQSSVSSTTAAAAAGDKRVTAARGRWQRAVGLVVALLRWQQVLRPTSGTSAPPKRGLSRAMALVPPAGRQCLDLVRNLSTVDVAATETSSSSPGIRPESTAAANAQNDDNNLPLVSALASAAVRNQRRAAARARGFAAFETLLKSLNTPSLAVDLLAPLAPALRTASTVNSSEEAAFAVQKGDKGAGEVSGNCHCLDGLDAIGAAAASHVRKHSAQLFGVLLQCLARASSAVDESTGLPGTTTSSSSLPLETTKSGSSSSSTSQLLDSPSVLMLCHTLSLVRFDPIDWSSLRNCRALDIALKVARRLETSHAALLSEISNKGSSGNTASSSSSSFSTSPLDARQATGGASSKRRSSPNGSGAAASSSSSNSSSNNSSSNTGAAAVAQKRLALRTGQCAVAARSFYRLFVSRLAQLGVDLAPLPSAPSAWTKLIGPCFEVLRSDLQRGLTIMRPGSAASSDAAPDPQSELGLSKDATSSISTTLAAGKSTCITAIAAASTASSTSSGVGTQSQQWQVSVNGRPGHRRRCQELLTSPRQFVHMEDGLTIEADQLLHNSKGPDFSMTFWLYLTQDSTGQPRAVLTRGARGERWPCILLREGDRRLEARKKRGNVH